MNDDDVFYRISMIMNVDPAEIAKIVHDYIERDIGCGTVYDRFNSPPPPIPIRPVKLMTLRDRIIEESAKELQNKVDKQILQKEDNKMNATSTENFHDVIAIDFELQTFPNPDVQDKFIVTATNRDDIFCFVFEGPYIADTCRKAGLFSSWEKDQKIKELEEELGRWKKEASDCLRLRDEVRREKNEEINKLKQQLQKVERDKKRITGNYERLDKYYNGLLKDYHQLKDKLDLERAANEAHHKFFREYAGKGTEIEFNYAIDDTKEVSYVIVDKKTYDEKPNINLHGMDFTPDELVDRILELEKLKTPTIENFAKEEPSSRSDILDLAKKCVCGKREQDYGTPESNFQLIADLWNQYLFKEPGAKEVFGIGPMDVAMMMGLMKIARIRNGGGSGDSFVDLAGYAACGGEIWHSNKETDGDSSQETN